MEERKTFGAYILRRRRELGLTQKEFAQRLYVTGSAVSKWERGLSYPDITLLREICAVLQISEHELLTGSEDAERCVSEKLAGKYLRIARNYRWTQYALYAGVVVGCLIGNLCAQRCMNRFFIALFGVMVSASLTLAPAIGAMHPKTEHFKTPIALARFTVSPELLLLSCCLYTGGEWFPVALVATLLGFTLVLLPIIGHGLVLPAALENRRASCYLLLETALLVCALYTGRGWFGLATLSVLFGLGFFVTPVLFAADAHFQAR